MIRPDSDVTLFTKENVEKWRSMRHGVITQRMRGSQVEIEVRLQQGFRIAFNLLIACAAIGVAFIIYKIAFAFLTGRVQAVLNAARLTH